MLKALLYWSDRDGGCCCNTACVFAAVAWRETLPEHVLFADGNTIFDDDDDGQP